MPSAGFVSTALGIAASTGGGEHSTSRSRRLCDESEYQLLKSVVEATDGAPLSFALSITRDLSIFNEISAMLEVYVANMATINRQVVRG